MEFCGLFTYKISLVCTVPPAESRVILPDDDAIVFADILTLPRVLIPVDLKLLTVTSPVKLVCGRVAIPAIVKLSAANVPSTSTPQIIVWSF